MSQRGARTEVRDASVIISSEDKKGEGIQRAGLATLNVTFPRTNLRG